MTEEIEAEQILEIHPDSRYALLLPPDWDDAQTMQAGEVLDEWWHGKNGQTPILILPGNMQLKLIKE